MVYEPVTSLIGDYGEKKCSLSLVSTYSARGKNKEMKMVV